MSGEHVVLVGLMGSGKTTVGRIVADRLGRPFVDSDEMIEVNEGRTVREIWLADGEPAYRKLETAVLLRALADPRPSVIAAAGGVVLAEENRDALRKADTLVVWLAAEPSVLVARTATGEHRPLLDDDPAAALAAMAADREALYREVADAIVESGGQSIDAVADEIVKLVERG